MIAFPLLAGAAVLGVVLEAARDSSNPGTWWLAARHSVLACLRQVILVPDFPELPEKFPAFAAWCLVSAALSPVWMIVTLRSARWVSRSRA